MAHHPDRVILRVEAVIAHVDALEAAADGKAMRGRSARGPLCRTVV
jgi:hypothetical protein